ncbi:hypothetical protein [Tenacibaculum agarivorans]|uniref:hypothetical protein n=1 Tax=Tenacibaculum agarivorans TaxID=1908389 RepID=UPI00094B8957|nr:hypothetical protein [Tenacibaculum agarivorans]
MILLIPLVSLGQVKKYDEIKVKVILDKQPLPGTSIIIENSENQDSFNTDFDGEVKIKIPNDKDRIRLSFIGPIVRMKILRHVDSIVVNLDTKKVYYFMDGKRMKKRKIKFSGY